MPRPRLLSEQQRARLLALPEVHEVRLILRYYTFSKRDLQIIARQNHPANQFALAVQLCFLRYPGRVWGLDEKPPDYLLNYISQQVQLSPVVLQDYNPLAPLRRKQLQVLRNEYGFRYFDESNRSQLMNWIYPLALSSNKVGLLLQNLVEKMRQEAIIIPAVSSLEDFLSPILEQANQETFATLSGHLTSQQIEALDVLLKAQTATGQSYLHWLQAPPGAVSVNNLLDLLDRLNVLRALQLDMRLSQQLNPNRLSQLARTAQHHTPWRLRELRDKQEFYAILVAFVLQETRVIIDEVLKMFLILYQQVFKRAKTVQQEAFLRDAKAVNLHLNHYVAVGKALIAARQNQTNPFEAIEAILPWEKFIQSVGEAETIVRPPSFDFVPEIDRRYSYIRRFSRSLLQAFDFQGHEESLPLRQGLALLREVDANERETLPDEAPKTFIAKQWQPYLFKDGVIQRRFYELGTLEQLRDHLRSGDIWVKDSLNFRPLTDFLIPPDQWQGMVQQRQLPIAMPLEALSYLRPRHEILHEQLQRVEEGLTNKTLPEVEILGERLKLGRTKLDIPKDMQQVTRAVYKLLPRIPITDLLLEVDASVHFSRHFSHLQSGDPLDNPVLLCTALLAGAINLGLEKMALVSHHSTYDKLSWIHDCFIRDETYAKALTEMVHFQMANPFAYHWGSGTTASSDSQYFPVGETQSDTAHRNPYYGTEPGIAFYTHLSDQYSPFYTQVIATRVREAPYMLNGLLHHDTQLDIQEHSTDTKGYTDHIFALCHLLGFSFAPRIRHFGELKLFPIKQKKNYPLLKPLLGQRIKTDLIYEDWLDMLWIAASLKLGTVTPPVFVQKLAHYPRQNRWARSLLEIGRLERTLFSLQWIQDLALRQRVNASLYKGEARNSLARAVCLHRLGRIRDRSYDEQRYRASALNLVVTAIIIWNTIYIEQAVAHLRSQGMAITDHHLEHLTPLGWEHIALTGDYRWNTSLTTNLQNLRDLKI